MDESASIFAACQETLSSRADLDGVVSAEDLDASALGLDIDSGGIFSTGGFTWTFASNVAGLLVMGIVLQVLSYISLRLFSRELR